MKSIWIIFFLYSMLLTITSINIESDDRLYFDFHATEIHIKEAEDKTSIFSPFNLIITSLIMLNRDSDSETDLTKRYKQILQGMNNKKISFFHEVHEEKMTATYSSLEQLDKVQNDNLYKIIKKQFNWNKKCVNFLSKTCDKETQELKEPFYHSYLYFKDSFDNIFDKRDTGLAEFYPKNQKAIIRPFMNTKKIIKACKAKIDNKEFFIVALPLKHEKSIADHKRVMVYLIPKDNDYALSDLWEDFSKFLENNVATALKKCSDKLILLSIPKLSKVVSNIDPDLKSITKTRTKIKIKSTAFIEIVEGKKSLLRCWKKKSYNHKFNVDYYIKADRPYISFVYDSYIKRIIFILKDFGFE